MKYKPRSHGENRMKHEGDVSRARKLFLSNSSKNLAVLLENRFSWMNKYISKDQVGMEVGSGTGVSKNFIECADYITTDYCENEWLDVKNIDALATGFPDNKFDFVVSSNMIHHVPYPMRFFDEMRRVLKPGGRLIIQEINCSFFMRILLRLMRHEGFDFEKNVYDRELICTDPDDLWSANCAIPNLLFDDIKRFNSEVNGFKVEYRSYSEFFMFINSGGVISKTAHIPLPVFLLKALTQVDKILTGLAPKIFALQRQIVLLKTNE